MKFCDKCGSELNKNSNFCPSCGKSCDNVVQGNSTSIIICAIIGILFPLLGIVLFFLLKKTDIKAAKTADRCALIGIIFQVIYVLFLLQ